MTNDFSHFVLNDDAADVRLLELSELLDADCYRLMAGIDSGVSAAEHYLRLGWQSGLNPGPNFDGAFLYPYYSSAGFSEPPALTYLTLRAAGWPVYATRAEAERLAEVLRTNDLFDAEAYARGFRVPPELDPALHYVLIGERIGHRPSERFDPNYYRERYPDIAAAGVCYLWHYISHGHQEGRRRVSEASELIFESENLNPNVASVLLVSHQASRTGAPILAYNIATKLRRRYNVIALLLSDGELVDDFRACCATVIGPLTTPDLHPVEATYLVKRLVRDFSFSYALVNSIASRVVLRPLACSLVPTVSLVHEFSSFVAPKGEMGRSLEWSTHVVFSTELVAASARAEYPNLDNRAIHIRPQGPSELPLRIVDDSLVQDLREKIRPKGSEDAFIVLCCGTVTLRKGTDLFLACAATVRELAPTRPVRFVWIGEGLGSEREREYSAFLLEQISRSNLYNTAIILNEVMDLEPAYALADVFFLSSRLDPLPNVTIDAALRGVPIICFENATGFAEILRRNKYTALGVVPYLDVYSASKRIVQLVENEADRTKLRIATRVLAESIFNMDQYVQAIDDLGRNASEIMQQRFRDFEAINSDKMFDMNLFVDPGDTVSTRQDAIYLFLARSAALGVGKRPTVNFYYRRPAPGFHPQIYAHENSHKYDVSVVNPLAEFIRNGKPNGPWRHDVITPSLVDEHIRKKLNIRTAIHGHFHYPELVEDFLRKIAINQSRCDLLLSTTDEVKAERLGALTRSYERGKVTIRLVPNRGRDIGAFLTAFGEEIVDCYEIIGHLHGKRSLFIGDSLVGETWREFLWQNLVGDRYPMMDIILDRFAKDDGLGILFPEDPHLSDWDFNREIATDLAERMGIELPLPPFFDFPVGTMFWARSMALRPLFDLQLAWSDYPKEPIAIDGTILHAIERILPFVASRAGFRYATSHLPGVTW